MNHMLIVSYIKMQAILYILLTLLIIMTRLYCTTKVHFLFIYTSFCIKLYRLQTIQLTI